MLNYISTCGRYKVSINENTTQEAFPDVFEEAVDFLELSPDYSFILSELPEDIKSPNVEITLINLFGEEEITFISEEQHILNNSIV